jgi:hypothetical protein
MTTKSRASLRFRPVLALLGAALLHIAVLTLPAPVHAERDLEAEETDETINKEVQSLRQDQRLDAKGRARLKALEQQHQQLEFKKRTGTPFRSERDLRHDLKRNDAQQGWQKGENSRMDFETRRQQQDIRNQTESWRQQLDIRDRTGDWRSR